MRSSTAPLIALACAAFLAGCLAPAAPTPPGPDQPAATKPTHVLLGALEPEGLAAPVFQLLGTVARGGPVYGAGEPSVWAHLDGTLFIAFPGCDNGPYYLVQVPNSAPCRHGLVFRSTDDGRTWTRLNRASDGRLTDDGPAANGDADVTVDANGTVYTSNLGGGIQVHKSDDGGTTWSYLANVVPRNHWADRQWMAAGHGGHLIMAWMGGATTGQRAVAINATLDGGATWTGTQYFGQSIGWLGTVQFDPEGERAFLPFTQQRSPSLTYGGTFDLLVLRSLDRGATWDVVPTGVTITTTQTGLHWSGVLMAPALDVTGDGTIVVAWSEETGDPTGTAQLGARVRLVSSPDGGDTWTRPTTVSQRAGAIMPWITGGAGDRAAVVYFASDAVGPTDYVGAWDVEAAIIDGVASDAPRIVRTVVEPLVHVGGICARGGLCTLTGSDRALLDFFEADLLPDGRLAVVYPADPPQGGKHIDIRFALQSGGTPLLARGA